MNKGNQRLVTSSPTSQASLLLLLVLLLAIVFPTSTCGQFSGPGRFKGFKWADLFAPAPGQPQTNQIKTLIIGEEAQPQLKGLILLKGTRIITLLEDGRTNVIATAPHCIFDPAQKSVFSSGPLEVETAGGQLVIQGEGFHCYVTNLNLVISNQVRTVIRRDLIKTFRSPAPQLSALATNAPVPGALESNLVTHANSEHFNFDYESNLITYTGNVRVEDPQMEMNCQELTIRRSPKGAIERIVADREVVIVNKQDRSRAVGDQAIYTLAPNQELIELVGKQVEWADGQRQGRADRFIFDRRNQSLRAERQAWVRLPRAALAQPQFAVKAGSSTNAPGSSSSTNASFVEISSEILIIHMPSTNRAGHRIEALTNVVVLSPGDRSRATAEQAIYSEPLGVVQLDGNAVWQTDQRIVKGDSLFLDRTNRIFNSRGKAYLKIPLAELGKQAVLPLPHPPHLWGGKGRGNAAQASPAQFIEVFSEEIDYQSDLLTFRGNVLANYLDGATTQGTLNCRSVSIKFSNQVERVIAHENVQIQQHPLRTRQGKITDKFLHCQLLTIDFWTNGYVSRVLAETNVLARQSEVRPGRIRTIHTELASGKMEAHFFQHTNQVREIVAEQKVNILQEDKRASGEKAVYYSTNNVVELTGNPKAELPEGRKITRAKMIVWDRNNKKLRLIGDSEGEIPLPAKTVSQTNLRSGR